MTNRLAWVRRFWYTGAIQSLWLCGKKWRDGEGMPAEPERFGTLFKNPTVEAMHTLSPREFEP
jgi:hypothetical protein